MTERVVRHTVRQSTFNEDGTLTLLLGTGYLEGNTFVMLSSFFHDMTAPGLATFFGGTPDASLTRVADLTTAINQYLLNEGVIFTALYSPLVA